MNRIAAKAEEDDIVLIYFSGHGHVDQGQTYLCLEKTRLDNLSEESLPLAELFQSLRICSAKKQLVLVDACHSADSQSIRHRGDSQSIRSKGQEEVVIALSVEQSRLAPAAELLGAFDHYAKNTVIPGLGFYALLSCDRDQQSYEFPELGHGVFTYFLIKGLEGGAADSGVIRPSQLFNYVLRNTSAYTANKGIKQTPRSITNATIDFEIGVLQNQADSNVQQIRESRLEEYGRIYREIRRQGLPTEDDNSRLLQARLRIRIRDWDAHNLEDIWNHRFELCENDTTENLKSKILPMLEACDPELLVRCQQEELLDEDIEYVWSRIVDGINQQFEHYQSQIRELLSEHGLGYDFSLMNLPDGLTEVNVQEARERLVEEFEQRLNSYEADFSDHIARYSVIPDSYSDDLVSIRQALRTKHHLLEKPYITEIESQVIAMHRRKLERFKTEAKLVITSKLLPLDTSIDLDLQHLGEGIQLHPNVVRELVDELCNVHQQNLEECKHQLHEIIRDCYPKELTESHHQQIQELAENYLLSSLVNVLLDQVRSDYSGRVAQYEQRVSRDLHHYDQPRFEHISDWEYAADRLKLSDHTVDLVEEKCRREYQNKKVEYQENVQQIVRQNGTSIDVDGLFQQAKAYQEFLNLLDSVAYGICEQQWSSYSTLCQRYAQIYAASVKDCYPPSSEAQDLLIQEGSGIHPDDIERIEEGINQQQENSLEQYRQQMSALVYACYPFNDEIKKSSLMPELYRLQQRLNLGDKTVEAINEEIVENYRIALSAYRKSAEKLLKNKLSLQDVKVVEALQEQQVRLGILNDTVVAQLHKEVEQYTERRRAEKQDARRERIFVTTQATFTLNPSPNLGEGLQSGSRSLLPTWEKGLEDKGSLPPGESLSTYSFSNQDPEQQLNQALERWTQDYELDDDDRKILHEEFWADDVESPEGAATVLHDLEELLRERHQNFRQYRAEMATFISQFHQLDTSFEEQLTQKRERLQDDLGLSEKRTDPSPIVKRHRKSLDHYKKAVHDLAQQKQSLVFNEDDRAYLDNERQTLEPTVAQRIEQDLLEQKRQEYRHKLTSQIVKAGQMPSPEFIKTLQVAHWLDESLVQDLAQDIEHKFRREQFIEEPIECPRCGKKSLIKQDTHRYHCLWCHYQRDLSEPDSDITTRFWQFWNRFSPTSPTKPTSDNNSFVPQEPEKSSSQPAQDKLANSQEQDIEAKSWQFWRRFRPKTPTNEQETLPNVYSIYLTTQPAKVSLGSELQVTLHVDSSFSHKQPDTYLLEIPQVESVGNELNIFLTAPGFRVEDDDAASLPLDANTQRTSQTTNFRLTALRPGSTTITAELYRGDTFETALETTIQVLGLEEAAFLNTSIKAEPRPVSQPDLVLQVQTQWNETAATCTFCYQLRSFRAASLLSPGVTYQSLPLSRSWLDQVQELLNSALATLSDALPADGRSHLTSLGQTLFQQLFPADLQTDLRHLNRHQSHTLMILADQDAQFPWTLLHNGQEFLGERFIIGHWLWDLNNTHPYEFPVGAINLAHYANIQHPETWATLLEPPGAPPPLILAGGMLDDLATMDAMRGLHLLRLGQCTADADRWDAPVPLGATREDQDLDQTVRPIKLNLRRNRPLVTLGYLRTDQPELTHLQQTWAATFLRAGCSAFVGSLWAVNPATEAAFISSFYHALWKGDSLGGAFHTAQRLAHAAMPDSLDWLAYCLFGDPMARPYRPIQGQGYAVVEPIGQDIADPVSPGTTLRFRVSLRRTPPIWHEERVIEVAETLTFNDLQAHIITFGLQVTPTTSIPLRLTPSGNYLGWFNLSVPPDLTGDSALVQVYFADGMQTIHTLTFPLTIQPAGGQPA